MFKNLFDFRRYSIFFWITLISTGCATILSIITIVIPLSQNSILKKISDLSLKLMWLHHVGDKSNYPEISRVYYIFTIPMIIGFFGLLWRWAKQKDGHSETGVLFIRKENLKIYHRLGLILVSSFSSIIFIAGWLGFTAGDSRLFYIGSSLVDLILMGWIFPASASICLLLILACLKKAIIGRL